MRFQDKKAIFKRPLRLIPLLVFIILELLGLMIVPDGIPPMGHITLSVITLLASTLINNRYISVETEQYLKSEVEQRTRALGESENRFRSLVTNIPGVAYRCLPDPDWTMLYISPKIKEQTGYGDEDFIYNRGRTFASVIHPDDLAPVYDNITLALKSGKVFSEEYRIVDRKGNIRWILDRGIGISGEDGRIGYIDGVLLDLTEEKRLAREKEDLEKQYRQAQKMESIGRLAGGIAHDLNNLLTPILGYAELLRSSAENGNEADKYSTEIIGASLRARELIQQLLSYARYQKQEFSDLDMNSLIGDFLNLLRKTIRENIVINFHKSPDLPPVTGNRNQLEQVIMNLAINAQDAMPEGGTITIGTYERDHKAVLTFSDTGTGMDSETEEHLFEPFFSTKGNEGNGLGLASVYGIIQQHGGEIFLSTAKDRGTQFRIELPLSKETIP